MWSLLVMVWTSLRCDDLQGLDPGSLSLSPAGLVGTLLRTKTTGPGRRALRVSIFMARRVSLSGRDWLPVGLALLKEDGLDYPRDYFMPDVDRDMKKLVRRPMEPARLALQIRHVLMELGTPRRSLEGLWKVNEMMPLLPDEAAMHYTGHSARNFLPTVSAVAGFSREQRDYLGRWQMGLCGAAEYTRSARQIVCCTQEETCSVLLSGAPHTYYEDEVLDALRDHVSATGGSGRAVRRRHASVWHAQGDIRGLGGEFPLIRADPGEDIQGGRVE